MKKCYLFFHDWIYPEYGVRHCTKCLKRYHWNRIYETFECHGKHPLSTNDPSRKTLPERLPLRLPTRPI